MVSDGAVGKDGIAGGVLGIGGLYGYFHPIDAGLTRPPDTPDPTQPLVTAHSHRLFRGPGPFSDWAQPVTSPIRQTRPVKVEAWILHASNLASMPTQMASRASILIPVTKKFRSR